MIAGPILPRTTESLRRLALEQSDRFETGLHVLRGEVELDGAGTLDALVLDASGRIGLMFLSDFDREGLASEISRVAAWWTRNARLLLGSVPELVEGIAREPRFLVYAFEYTAKGLEDLRRLDVPGLEVCRVEAIRIEHEVSIGVVPVDSSIGRLSVAAATGEARFEDGRTVASEPSAFDLPAEFASGHESVLDELTDRLERLDPKLRVVGDRFLRRYIASGQDLFSLRRGRDGVFVGVPGDQKTLEAEYELTDAAEGRRAFDQIMRRYCRMTVSEPVTQERRRSGTSLAGPLGRIGSGDPATSDSSTRVLRSDPEPSFPKASSDPSAIGLLPVPETRARAEERRPDDLRSESAVVAGAGFDDLPSAHEPATEELRSEEMRVDELRVDEGRVDEGRVADGVGEALLAEKSVFDGPFGASNPPSSAFRVEEAELTDDELGAFLSDD